MGQGFEVAWVVQTEFLCTTGTSIGLFRSRCRDVVFYSVCLAYFSLSPADDWQDNEESSTAETNTASKPNEAGSSVSSPSPEMPPEPAGWINTFGPNRMMVSDMAKVDAVAERECIVKLIEIIDTSMQRKTLLLESIAKLNSVAAANKEELSAMSPEQRRSSSFLQHYTWLIANLEVTTRSLESAMVHLQIMYGKGYSPG